MSTLEMQTICNTNLLTATYLSMDMNLVRLLQYKAFTGAKREKRDVYCTSYRLILAVITVDRPTVTV